MTTCAASGRPGPSPRVRGSRGPDGRHRAGAGSIPACAGKPPTATRAGRPTRVHPRVCGEALLRSRFSPNARGPSPRVRGSPAVLGADLPGRGSIPACAGKPTRPTRAARTATVHPRVCGEAPLPVPAAALQWGPSPRVRGSREEGVGGDQGDGSIPACAGKPTPAARWRVSRRVHPRVCGEAGMPPAVQRIAHGPSPRVRGSQRRPHGGVRRGGSIPACAGKPRSSPAAGTDRGVHPRVCGEADTVAILILAATGPSPRVRGSLLYARRRDHHAGSIPACAGKPSAGRSTSPAIRVHPRVCGEARRTWCGWRSVTGPSPRVRGSHDPDVDPLAALGSIPACAGKPSRGGRYLSSSWVHPRVCGEAEVVTARKILDGGPSPRVRGSPPAPRSPGPRAGSIPACAGKPGARRSA